MKIMAVNAGSSSLKFQLLNMPSEEELVSGVVERIGQEISDIKIKLNGDKLVEKFSCPDHAVAVDLLLKKLVELKIVSSIDEIEKGKMTVKKYYH